MDKDKTPVINKLKEVFNKQIGMDICQIYETKERYYVVAGDSKGNPLINGYYFTLKSAATFLKCPSLSFNRIGKELIWSEKEIDDEDKLEKKIV